MFDSAHPIRSIKFSIYAQNKIPTIGFFDEHDEMVASYDPEGYGLELNAETRTLAADEALVGIYGVKDRKKWFTSLGFIVLKKTKPQEGKTEVVGDD